MAIGIIFDADGVTQAQYERVKDAVAPGNRAPAGLLYHAAGPTERGWAVVEIWESEEDLQRFFEEQLGRELQAAGIAALPKQFRVVNTMQP